MVDVRRDSVSFFARVFASMENADGNIGRGARSGRSVAGPTRVRLEEEQKAGQHAARRMMPDSPAVGNSYPLVCVGFSGGAAPVTASLDAVLVAPGVRELLESFPGAGGLSGSAGVRRTLL